MFRGKCDGLKMDFNSRKKLKGRKKFNMSDKMLKGLIMKCDC